MNKKLKILAASDVHGDSLQCVKLADRAVREGVDFVVLCGDLTSPMQNSNIIKPFLQRGKKVLFVPGNHDGFALGDFLAQYYKITNLHRNTAVYETLGFFGCGGANIGWEALTDQEAFEHLQYSFYQLPLTEKKIMVTHVHPSGTIVDRILPNAGSLGVRKALERFQPDLLLCGHVHEAAGVEDHIGKTRVVHVGREGTLLEL